MARPLGVVGGVCGSGDHRRASLRTVEEREASLEDAPSERIPEAWIGQVVNLQGVVHYQGVLRGVNEYGITYETVSMSEKVFVPWHQVAGISPSGE